MQSRPRASPRCVAVEALAPAIAMICGVALALGAARLASAEPIAFDIQVVDEPGGGFNDPVLGPKRLNAMRTAADLWGTFFANSFPGQTVDVQVEMVPSLGDYG